MGKCICCVVPTFIFLSAWRHSISIHWYCLWLHIHVATRWGYVSMLNVWTIDLCKIWVAPPTHSLVALWYIYKAQVIKFLGNSVRLWVWDYGKPKRENKKVCINEYICIHAFHYFWYYYILMKCLHLIYCIALWIFMFVLAEL